jgi:cytochrome c553
MTMQRRFIIAAIVLLASGAASGVSAADLGAGKAKAAEVCAACHGADGNSATPDFPRIGGQYADYLAKALRDYKSGQRKNAIMAGFAQALSKQDVENLAAYYAAQPATVAAKH